MRCAAVGGRSRHHWARVCDGQAIIPDVLIDREIMTWATDLGRVDTMVGIPDAEGLPVVYTDLAPRALVLPLDDIDVEVASLDDVITSKEFAGRSKDTRALPELRHLRDLRANQRPPEA